MTDALAQILKMAKERGKARRESDRPEIDSDLAELIAEISQKPRRISLEKKPLNDQEGQTPAIDALFDLSEGEDPQGFRSNDDLDENAPDDFALSLEKEPRIVGKRSRALQIAPRSKRPRPERWSETPEPSPAAYAEPSRSARKSVRLLYAAFGLVVWFLAIFGVAVLLAGLFGVETPTQTPIAPPPNEQADASPAPLPEEPEIEPQENAFVEEPIDESIEEAARGLENPDPTPLDNPSETASRVRAKRRRLFEIPPSVVEEYREEQRKQERKRAKARR